MKYLAKFDYRANTDDGTFVPDVPLAKMEVNGGSNRIITFSSSNDFSLGNELEQAKEYKNIVLYMPPTDGGLDMQVALDFTAIANKGLHFNFLIMIEKLTARQNIVEAYVVSCSDAKLKNPPELLPGRILKISVEFVDKVGISQGKYNKKEQSFRSDPS
jgi:hypothetical protein